MDRGLKGSGGKQPLDVVVVDVETTGLSPESDEIIEIGAVRWSDGVAGEHYQTFVRPTKRVPKEIYDLTGISASDLASAPTMEEVLPKFLSFIAGASLAGHHVGFDIGFLVRACDACGYDFPTSVDGLDTRQLARILLPFQQEFRLTDIARYFQLDVVDFHRALADAVTTAGVLTALLEKAKTLPFVTLQTLERLASAVSPLLANWFYEASEVRLRTEGTELPSNVEVIHQLAFSKRPQTRPEFEVHRHALVDDDTDIGALSGALLSEDSPILSFLPGFEVRDGQKQMVEAVVHALLCDKHLIAEAGTGTGKSLAYLIPSALYALNSDQRVVIATHTIALQDQIRDRDFPTLRSVVSKPIELAVFKGRTHYVCMRKLWQDLRTIGIGWSSDEVEAYMALVSWLVATPEGNREELAQWGRMPDVWPRIQSETETCIIKRCPFFKSCYYFRARQAAFDANVVVTNHSLILSDLKADHRVLPKYDKLILDEAHHLEEEATKHLGDEVHMAHCMALMGRLVRDSGRHGVLAELSDRLTREGGVGHKVLSIIEHLMEQLPKIRVHTEDAFKSLWRLIPNGQNELRITTATLSTQAWTEFLECVEKLTVELGSLTELQSALHEHAEAESDEELSGRIFDAHGFIYEVVSNVTTLCSAGHISDHYVQWVERSQSGDRVHISFHRAPIDVGKILADTLFEGKSSVVLTSATLSVEGRFDYLLSRIGLQEAHSSGQLSLLTVPSPFDMPKQALLCVPSDVPELAKLSTDEAALWLSDSLYQLAKASKGKLLALFTSHAMLRATAHAVRGPLRQAGLELFAQGIDGSRSRILETFRTHPNAVLFGAQSFWEGIDLPGDQLTTLVIVRLPFAPPSHPVTAARHERLERQGKSSFWAASLPEAVVRFRQGFGRLIRTVHDRGTVVVYDKRIITTRYGSTFIKSLQGVEPFVAPEADVIRRVNEFLHQETAKSR